MGNQNVKLKHKVQLRKKVEEKAPVLQPEEVNTPRAAEPKVTKSSKSRIWWVLGSLVVLCIIIGIAVSKSDKSEETTSNVEDLVTEKIVTVSEDSVGEEQFSDNQAELNEETSTEPATKEAVTKTAAQAGPTAKETSTSAAANVSSDVEAEAMKVIRGDYGIGQERKEKLGTQYQTIQNRVNELKREGLF